VKKNFYKNFRKEIVIMANPFETIPGDRGVPERRDCDKCNGTGKIGGKKCDKCNGSGKLK
jgi:hypothetical protein